MELANAYANAESAIAAAETIHRCLEATLWDFYAVAVAEGWTDDEVDDAIARFGFCLREPEPAECQRH